MYVHISLTSLLTAVNSIHFTTCLRCIYYITITGNIYLSKNVGMTCAKVRLRCTGIDLFDRNVGMTCTNIRIRCSWKSLVLVLSKCGYGIC